MSDPSNTVWGTVKSRVGEYDIMMDKTIFVTPRPSRGFFSYGERHPREKLFGVLFQPTEPIPTFQLTNPLREDQKEYINECINQYKQDKGIFSCEVTLDGVRLPRSLDPLHE